MAWQSRLTTLLTWMDQGVVPRRRLSWLKIWTRGDGEWLNCVHLRPNKAKGNWTEVRISSAFPASSSNVKTMWTECNDEPKCNLLDTQPLGLQLDFALRRTLPLTCKRIASFLISKCPCYEHFGLIQKWDGALLPSQTLFLHESWEWR